MVGSGIVECGELQQLDYPRSPSLQGCLIRIADVLGSGKKKKGC